MEPGDRALIYSDGAFGFVFADGSGSSFSGELYRDGPSGAEGPSSFSCPAAGLSPAAAIPTASTLALFDASLAPYRFGGFQIDPLETLRGGMERALGSSSLARALWATVEAELFRFAFDQSFTGDLETARDSDDWRRFARLNQLYRAISSALVPIGVVPGGWTGWLRGEPEPRRSAWDSMIERAFTRPIGAIASRLSRSQFAGGLFDVAATKTIY